MRCTERHRAHLAAKRTRYERSKKYRNLVIHRMNKEIEIFRKALDQATVPMLEKAIATIRVAKRGGENWYE